MLAVVETVDAVIATLRQTGDLANTYIIFASDNGFHLGQHRLAAGKGSSFEEDLRVPLIVRGPGIPAGRVLPHMAVNIDLAPTFADLAGVSPTVTVDGRSLVPLLGASPPPVSAWRHAFLLEHGFAGRHLASGALGAGDQPSTEIPDLDETLAQALGDAVAFGLAYEGRRGLDAEEGDLGLEVVRHVVGAVVVAELQPRCHVLADRAEVAAHPLPNRLQGLEAVGAPVGVDADAFAVAVVDGDEDVGHALGQGDGLAHVGAPHDVHGRGSDAAVARLVRPLADPVSRQ